MRVMTPTPEFSRLIPVDRIPEAGLDERIEADDGERAALAQRFDVPEISSFAADFHIAPWRRGRIHVQGTATAQLLQRCVITLDPFPVELVFPVERFFIAEGARHDHVEELEGDEPDIVSGAAVDLGELAAEELALNLDPYPRKPGAELAAEIGGVQPENEQGNGDSPFAALRKLVKSKDRGE
jgi:uncharacterized metal-binding protein YceD (DUF177 family)